MKILTQEEMLLRKEPKLLFKKTTVIEEIKKIKKEVLCDNCGSNRIIGFTAHCIDSFDLHYKNKYYDGYVPNNIGIGYGDDVEIDYCVECGKIQGKFPIDDETIHDNVFCDEED